MSQVAPRARSWTSVATAPYANSEHAKINGSTPLQLEGSASNSAQFSFDKSAQFSFAIDTSSSFVRYTPLTLT